MDDVANMTAAWAETQRAAYAAIRAAGGYSWQFLNCEPGSKLCGGNTQNAPGWNQTDPRAQCASYMRAQCGAPTSSPQARDYALFFGFTRVTHHQQFPLPSFMQDLAAFLLIRGPYAWIGFGWQGCIGGTNPFVQPPELKADYGVPMVRAEARNRDRATDRREMG